MSGGYFFWRAAAKFANPARNATNTWSRVAGPRTMTSGPEHGPQSRAFFGRGARAVGAVALVLTAVGGAVYYTTNPMPQLQTDPTKKTLLVLGSGWGTVSLLRKLDTSDYNTIVVSPRNYFLFTPLLPSVTTGSLESRSIITPIKYFLRLKPFGVRFVEAEATEIDPVNKTVTIADNSEIKGESHVAKLNYDYLVIGVGAENQTFGIPGVYENAMFLKEIPDAKRIRSRLMDSIESAAFPGQPPEEVNRLLHMVVVGGGPTGVEYAGELYDFLMREVRKWYPEIANKVKITLIEALPHVLPMFSREMINYTESSFKDMNIDILNSTAVSEVRQKELVVKDTKNSAVKRTIPYGLLVWATGNTTRPIVRDFCSKVEEQKSCRRGILVDDYLRVRGAPGVWALGDCTATRFAPTAQVAAQQGSYLARQLGDIALSESTGKDVVSLSPPFAYHHRATLAYIGDDRGVSDVKFTWPSFWGTKSKQTAGPGGNSATVAANAGDDNSTIFSFAGYRSYLFWRSAYLSNVFTLRNKALVGFDWAKEKLFGRDISRE